MTTLEISSVLGTTSPIIRAFWPCLLNSFITMLAESCDTTITIPIPQLKVRSISSVGTFPSRAIQVNISGISHEFKKILADLPSGNTLGMFSVNPPPVI